MSSALTEIYQHHPLDAQKAYIKVLFNLNHNRIAKLILHEYHRVRILLISMGSLLTVGKTMYTFSNQNHFIVRFQLRMMIED